MALTRKLLKGMNLTDEQMDTIIEAHTETVEALKSERDSYKEDAGKLKTVQKELDALKAARDDGYEEKYTKVKQEFDQYKKDQEAKEAKEAKAKAYRTLLQEIGISEKRIEKVLQLCDVDGVELDDKGNIKGADKLKENAKEEWSDFIVTTTTKGANTPAPPANGGNTKMTKEDIYKKDDKGRYVLSASERQKALVENQLT